MKQKGFAPIMIVFFFVVLLGAVGGTLYYLKNNSAPIISIQPVACTQDAKQCPDGSYVGRTGPKCEFATCPYTIPAPNPTPTPSPTITYCSGPGDTSCSYGYTCIQACGPPVARENDPPPPYYCETNEIASKSRMCPICLASNTNISTPEGDINVKDIKVGMKVWSQDENGGRILSEVKLIANTPAPKNHKVVHLVLSDKREVWVSPSHPAVNGLRVEELKAGDGYDGSKIKSVELVPYWDEYTYDILPDSDTGYYFANGILLGSTLK